MPITDIVILSVIVSAFAIFAIALAWGDYQTREIARASRERAAAGAKIAALKQAVSTEVVQRGVPKKVETSAA
jgi:sensor histidine kinase regulating citrate/malate metabolism